jgi:uncharacterized protein
VVATEAILYDVRDWEFNTDIELKQKGAIWPLHHSKYIVFNLLNPKPIKVPGKLGTLRGYRYTSKEGLLRYLETGDKNCFYLSNPDAARLYEELKKIKLEFVIKWIYNEVDPSLVEFSVGDRRILSSGIFPSLNFDVGNQYIHLLRLLKSLG